MVASSSRCKNVFLSGEKEKEVDMQLHPGLEKYYGTRKVCKLNKNLFMS